MGLILDTSILIASERNRFRLEELFSTHANDSFYIAAISAAELLHGVERAAPPERRLARSQFVEQVLHNLPIIDFDLPVARTHARIWAALASSGQTIGAHDLLIAATAIEHECQLATLNLAEFQRVGGLRLVDVQPYLSAAART